VSSNPVSPRVEISAGLPAATLAEVETLVSAATAADGVGPLSEQVMLHLRYGDEAPVHDLLDRTSRVGSPATRTSTCGTPRPVPAPSWSSTPR
jgi:hypothetical protein